MSIIHVYLRFDGNAREAFEFYKECLGGELFMQSVGDSPMAQFMPDKKGNVFHAQLKNGDLVILGSDMTENDLIHGNNMVVTLESDSKDEAKELFSKLSNGGKIGHDLVEQPWGMIGDFQDKFGVDWFVISM